MTFFFFFKPESTDVIRESLEFQAYFSLPPLNNTNQIKTNQLSKQSKLLLFIKCSSERRNIKCVAFGLMESVLSLISFKYPSLFKNHDSKSSEPKVVAIEYKTFADVKLKSMIWTQLLRERTLSYWSLVQSMKHIQQDTSQSHEVFTLLILFFKYPTALYQL